VVQEWPEAELAPSNPRVQPEERRTAAPCGTAAPPIHIASNVRWNIGPASVHRFDVQGPTTTTLTNAGVEWRAAPARRNRRTALLRIRRARPRTPFVAERASIRADGQRAVSYHLPAESHSTEQSSTPFRHALLGCFSSLRADALPTLPSPSRTSGRSFTGQATLRHNRQGKPLHGPQAAWWRTSPVSIPSLSHNQSHWVAREPSMPINPNVVHFPNQPS